MPAFEVSSENSLRRIGGFSGALGVILLGSSFYFAQAPEPGSSPPQLATFANLHRSDVLIGGLLQAIGPILIVLFAFALVHFAGAATRLAGWMTFFGATTLIIVSLIKVTFYIAALFPEPSLMGPIALHVIYAVQHLYFVVAAPALFLPLGLILLQSVALPKAFGYLALLLALAFFTLGIVFLTTLILPNAVTALASVQAVWWLAASLTFAFQRR